MWNKILACFLLSVLAACATPPDYPDEPVITYESMSRNSMNQGSLNNDSLRVYFTFTDGDGNLGSQPNENFVDVFLTDKRDGFLANTYRIPYIPEQGTGNGISGRVSLVIYTTCCVIPNFPPCTRTAPQFPKDTVLYDIQIMDRDSNWSNVIQTAPIVLNCI